METTTPLPLDPTPPPEADEKRLWIGNLDSRVTEYHLVKLLKRIGKVEKFDFLFHKSGPLRGQPRGYCFVTFENRKQAETCLAKLDGVPLLSKTMVVKWAHSAPTEENIQQKSFISSQKNLQPSQNSINSQISAIEAKLKAMDEGRDCDLEECLSDSVKNKSHPMPFQALKVNPQRGEPTWPGPNKRYNNTKRSNGKNVRRRNR